VSCSSTFTRAYFSGCGNLAAVVCQKAKLEGIQNRIKLQVLNCPSTDNALNNSRYPSYQRFASGYFLNKAFCVYTMKAYAPNEMLDNPEVGPINRQDLTGLPPALVLTSEFDPLRDEGQQYADRLQNAGVQVRLHFFAGQIHCLLGLPDDSEEQKLADQLLLASIKSFVTKKAHPR